MAALNDVQVNIVVSLKGQNKLKALDNAMRGLITVQKSLRGTTGKTVAGFKQLNQAAGTTAKAMSTAAKATKAGTVAAQAAAKAAAAASRAQAAAIKKSQSGLKGLASKLSEIEKKYDALFRASFRLQLVGAELLMAGKKMLSLLGDLTSEWGDFEFMVNRAAAAVQLFKGETAPMDKLYQTLITRLQDTSKELRLFPALDVAKATYFWASTTGAAVNSVNDMRNAVDAVNPIMKVAAMTETDYETAIKGVYSILVQYNMSLGRTAEVTEKLFLASQRTALEFPDLIQSFKMVGPIARSLGIQFDDVVDLLAQLGDAGIRGTMAGRAMRMMFIKLSKPTAAAAAALDELYLKTEGLGKTFNEIEFPGGEFVSTTQFINNLALALKDATMLEKNLLIGQISTRNEQPAITALIQQRIDVLNDVPGAMQHAKEGMTDTAYAADQFKRSWEMLATSWNGITQRIARGVEVIRLKIGQQLADALSPAIEMFTKMLDRVERWVSANPDIVRAIGVMMGGAGVALVLAGAAFIAGGALLGIAAGFSFVFEAIGSVMPRVLAVVGIFTALAEAIVNNWARIQRMLVPALRRLGDALGVNEEGLAGLKEWFDRVHDTVKQVANTIVRTLIEVLATLIDLITEIAKSPLMPFITGIAKALALAFSVKTILSVTGLAGAFARLTGTASTAAVAMTQAEMAAVGATAATNALKTSMIQLMLKSPLFWLVALTTAFEVLMSFDNPLSDFINGMSADVEELNNQIKDFAYNVGPAGLGMTRWMADTANESGRYAQKTIDAWQGARDAATIPGPTITGMGGKQMHLAGTLASAGNTGPKIDFYADQTVDVAKLKDEIVAMADAHFVSVRQISESMLGARNAYKMTYEDAKTYADTYFKFNEEGTKATPESITKAFAALKQNGIADKYKLSLDDLLKTNLDASDWLQILTDRRAMEGIASAKRLLASNQMEPAVEILNALKRNESGLGDEVKISLENAMSGIPKVVTDSFAEAEEAAEKGPKALVDALKAGFASVGDYRSIIKNLLKGKKAGGEGLAGATAKGLFKGVREGFDSKALAKDLSSNNLIVRQLAQQHMLDLYSQFALGLEVMTPEERNTEALNLEKYFGKAWKNGKVPTTFKGVKLTEEQRTYLQSMMDWAYGELGKTKPTPPADNPISKTGATLGKNLATDFRSAAWRAFETTMDARPTDEASNKPSTDYILTPAVDALTDPSRIQAVKDGVKYGLIDPAMSTINQYSGGGVNNPLYIGGANTADAWINGARSKIYRAQLAGDALADAFGTGTLGDSPPKRGPLKHIDKGGANIAQAWIKGISSKKKAVTDAADSLAYRMQTTLADHSSSLNADSTMSTSTDTTRRVSVEINVSSKDGTANNMTQQQIMTALRSGGLISNIERLAMVD